MISLVMLPELSTTKMMSTGFLVSVAVSVCVTHAAEQRDELNVQSLLQPSVPTWFGSASTLAHVCAARSVPSHCSPALTVSLPQKLILQAVEQPSRPVERLQGLSRKAGLNAASSGLDYVARTAVEFVLNPVLVNGLGRRVYGVSCGVLWRLTGYLWATTGRLGSGAAVGDRQPAAH